MTPQATARIYYFNLLQGPTTLKKKKNRKKYFCQKTEQLINSPYLVPYIILL